MRASGVGRWWALFFFARVSGGGGHAMVPYPERASPATTGFLHSDYFFAEWAQNTAGRRIIMFDLHFLNIGWEVAGQRVARLSNWGEFFSRSSDNHWKRILNPVVRTGLIYERGFFWRDKSKIVWKGYKWVVCKIKLPLYGIQGVYCFLTRSSNYVIIFGFIHSSVVTIYKIN